jgi:hypothetical protein
MLVAQPYPAPLLPEESIPANLDLASAEVELLGENSLN